MAYELAIKSRRHWTPARTDMDIFYRTSTFSYQNIGEKEFVFVKIGKGIMKEIGWTIGDPVILLQDDTNPLKLALKKHHSGYVLRPSSIPSETTYKELKGSTIKGTFQGNIDGLPRIPRTARITVKVLAWEISDNLLEFELPRSEETIKQLTDDNYES